MNRAIPLAIVMTFGACWRQSTSHSTSAATVGAGGAMTGSNTVTSMSSSATGGSGGAGGSPTTLVLTGKVVDTNNQPVPNAMVMQAGKRELAVLSASDGSYALMTVPQGNVTPTLLAAKIGYRPGFVELFEPPNGPVDLVVRKVNAPDNEKYVFADPGDGSDEGKENCSHCHAAFVKQFLGSKHAGATKNPLVQDLYAGVNRAYATQPSCESAGGAWLKGRVPGTPSQSTSKCYLAGGVLPDLNGNCGGANEPACDDPAIADNAKPTAFGACADCHAPGIDGKAGGRDLHAANGIAYDIGVHCDVCHKVRDIDLTKPAGIGQRLLLGRPNEPGKGPFEYDPVYYGPLPDVPNPFMNGSYQPKFKEAQFCAGCHEQTQPALVPGDKLDASRWPDGLPVHSTFDEWKNGPYNSSGTPCQFCHMPASVGPANATDLGTFENQSVTFGFARAPEDIRQHIFRGPLHGNPRLIDGAAYVSIKLDVKSNEVSASVSVSNVGCGHALPTGEPMRSMLLLVHADGNGCGSLTPSGGMTVYDVGGFRARGIEGSGLTTNASKMDWAAGAKLAKPGMIVRVVRPSGSFHDYAGVGVFGDPKTTAQQKGLEIMTPIGEASIAAVAGDSLTLSKAILTKTGDVVYLGDAWPDKPSDGQASTFLAGAAGYAFARVLVGSDGKRGVPHYRAIDIASDNRIPPGKNAVSQHVFALPAQCNGGTVRAQLVYRPLPVDLSASRGWDAKDYLIAGATKTWP